MPQRVTMPDPDYSVEVLREGARQAHAYADAARDLAAYHEARGAQLEPGSAARHVALALGEAHRRMAAHSTALELLYAKAASSCP